MSDHDPSAVSGVRRAIRELVDGTIRVQIDIDPRFAKDFHRLFAEIDMPVAIAPLVPEAVPDGRARSSENWKNLGPLAQSALMICKEVEFQQWVAERNGVERVNEEQAAVFLRGECKVSSRKELDTTDGARERLGDMMARYRQWLQE